MPKLVDTLANYAKFKQQEVSCRHRLQSLSSLPAVFKLRNKNRVVKGPERKISLTENNKQTSSLTLSFYFIQKYSQKYWRQISKPRILACITTKVRNKNILKKVDLYKPNQFIFPIDVSVDIMRGCVCYKTVEVEREAVTDPEILTGRVRESVTWGCRQACSRWSLVAAWRITKHQLIHLYIDISSRLSVPLKRVASSSNEHVTIPVSEQVQYNDIIYV